jgi:hypothetical protein
MTLDIPSGVLTKYNEVIDATITNMFGVTCQLVFTQKIEVISNTFDNIPQNKSIHAHMMGGRPAQFKRQTSTFKEVEMLEDLKMKVYWSERDFVKTSSNMALPDGAIQTIFFATDLAKIKRCKEIIVHKDIKTLQEMRFKLAGEPFPMGIKQVRYFGAFWERS